MTDTSTELANDTSNTHDDAACVKLFTDTMERLNEIAEHQMQSILDLAIAAADAAVTIEPGNNTAAGFVEQVEQTLNEMKALIEQQAKTGGDSSAHPAESAAGTGNAFCASVEHILNNAIANSATNQQQLNVIGAEVLTQGAKLVIDAGAQPPAEDDDQ